MEKGVYCPIIKTRCVAEVCVCYYITDVGITKEKLQAHCTYLNCKLGQSLQPKTVNQNPIKKLDDVEGGL